MNGQKLFYIFKDPMGSLDCKIGVTSNPQVRLGIYQTSYSRKSHIACFDTVYIGPSRSIKNLENTIKLKLDQFIEMGGIGHTEWVNKDCQTIENLVDEIIDGYKFKVTKISSEFLPLTIDNIKNLLEHLSFEFEKTQLIID
jgi:hypothetical protein